MFYFTMRFSTCVPAMAVLFVTTHALKLAEFMPQDFSLKRASYQGGWALALPGADCPSDAPVACSTYAGAVNPTCCPSGQTCKGSDWPYCCPTNGDCVNVVENLPVCANSTWNMYKITSTRLFCCEPGQIGILPLSGYTGICGYPEQAIASSLIATIASQIGGQAVTTVVGNTGGGAQPTSTKVITSTLKAGGVTTITSLVVQTDAATSTDATGASSTIPSTGSAATSKTASTSTKKKAVLGIGAIIGIAVGGVLILIIGVLAFLLVRSKRNKKANSQSQEYGGGAPMYSALPTPYQSEPQEYKSPAVGYTLPMPSPNPGAGHHGGGYVRGQEGQGGYGVGTPTPPPQQMYGGPPPPVEAPSAWERRVEIGGGR